MNDIVTAFAGRLRPPLAIALTLLLGAVAEAPAASATLRANLDRALAVRGVSREATAAVAIDLRSGGAVYRLHQARSLKPASTEKLTVALASLQKLGPAFRIATEVLGEGRLDGAVWRGRLVLKGYGDPTLSGADLTTLAARVKAAGIAKVTGRVLGDESFFDQRRTAAGWKPSFYKEESPPLSALVVNRAEVRGRTVDNPALAAAAAFRRALNAAGVRVASRAAVGAAAPGAVPLARVSSPRLALLVRKMNKQSDNFIAEMLLKELGARSRGRGTTAAGALVVARVLRERGVPLDGVRIVDGSGLSVYDRVTARALAALLLSAWSDPAVKDSLVRSLPVAGVDGTLEDRMRKPPARGFVRAKTGTTDTASTLSGFAGSRYVFVVLMNGGPIPWWYARRGQDRFAQLLAGAAD